MSNSFFQFKQFIIRHDRCSMKVGTDGVLLGAWAPLGNLRSGARVLDIGTGSGLIALMLAQRYLYATVEGIDINADAVSQAKENILASPFADRCTAYCCGLHDFTLSVSEDCTPSRLLYDAIVCNPPFFEESLLPTDIGRRDARHTISLPYEVLVHDSAQLMHEGARFAVILPTSSFESFHHLCFAKGLYLVARCIVVTAPGKPSKRTLVCYCKGEPKAGTQIRVDEETLTLMTDGKRSSAYTTLTRDFYL